MSTINIRLYDLFRRDLNLPDAKAIEFVEAIQQTSKEELAVVVEKAATKEYVKLETTLMAEKTYQYFNKDIMALQLHLDEKFKTIEDRFKSIDDKSKEYATKDFVQKEISVSKTETVKWFVSLFVTLALMILGLYAAILLKK